MDDLSFSISVFGNFPGRLGIILCVPEWCKTLSQCAELIGHWEEFSEVQIDLNLIWLMSSVVMRHFSKHFQELFMSHLPLFQSVDTLWRLYSYLYPFILFLSVYLSIVQRVCQVKITFIKLFISGRISVIAAVVFVWFGVMLRQMSQPSTYWNLSLRSGPNHFLKKINITFDSPVCRCILHTARVFFPGCHFAKLSPFSSETSKREIGITLQKCRTFKV